jgi:hypothetical protein
LCRGTGEGPLCQPRSHPSRYQRKEGGWGWGMNGVSNGRKAFGDRGMHRPREECPRWVVG